MDKGKVYDKSYIRERPHELVAYYLGPYHDEGGRWVWKCPACGKDKKFAVRKDKNKGGCLATGCEGAMYGDAFDLVAYFEGLDITENFKPVLKRAAEILGVDDVPTTSSRTGTATKVRDPQRNGPRDDSGSAPRQGNGSARFRDDMPPARTAIQPASRVVKGAGENTPAAVDEEVVISRERCLELCNLVYARILELCPLEKRDLGFWRRRGISYETIKEGRFGSISAERARYVKQKLEEEFGREALLRIPGFSEENGRLKFTLTGDYTLIPYHDHYGRIATIEGRAIGEPPKGMGKYVTLRNAGNHLYVFPGHNAATLEAITEGPIGAIVAAQSGISVGAIQGCRRYRASVSTQAYDGEPGGPIRQLADVDFAGRLVPYIPDSDDPPDEQVVATAPKAARYLVGNQNGTPALCWLPDGYDLDEWLLSIKPAEHRQRFDELIAGARPPEEEGFEPEAAKEETAGQEVAGQCPGETGSPEPFDEDSYEPADEDDYEEPEDEEGTQGEWEAEELTTTEYPDSGAREGREGERAEKPAVERTRAEVFRSEVYTRLRDLCPLEDSHVRLLSKKGVLARALEYGGFGSIDRGRARQATATLVEEYGAKRLLTVPGFEKSGAGNVTFSLSQASGTEYLLVPCYDSQGYLLALEALAVDVKRGEVETEETIPLLGAGSHLYVFAAYKPTEVEGFCEGILGALLAAQDGVVVGAIGGFRRYKAASGPAEGRQSPDAVLPELADVDFGGREIAHMPRVKPGEELSRAREVGPAISYLIERQNGRAKLVTPVEARTTGSGGRQKKREDSLGTWLLSVPEEDTQERLRKLFPHSPARLDQDSADTTGQPSRVDPAAESPDTDLAPQDVLSGVLWGIGTAAFVYYALHGLEWFSQYTGAMPGGIPIITDDVLATFFGILRTVAGSPPLEVLYSAKLLLAPLAGGALAAWRLWNQHRQLQEERAVYRAQQGPWTLHLAPEPDESRAPEAGDKGPLAGPTLSRVGPPLIVFSLLLVISWAVLWALEKAAAVAGSLGAIPHQSGYYFIQQPVLIAIAVAAGGTVFYLWQRMKIGHKEKRLAAGDISQDRK